MLKIYALIAILPFVVNTFSLPVSLQLPYTDYSLKNERGYAVFSGSEFECPTGTPDMPAYIVRFLLPPDADMASLLVSIKGLETETVAGDFDVRPVSPPMAAVGAVACPVDKKLINGKDLSVYSANEFYPTQFAVVNSVGKLWDLNIASVAVYPYRYNPVTKKCVKLKKGVLVLTVNTSQKKPELAMQIPRHIKERARNLTVNYADIAPSYGSALMSDCRAEGVFLIVTTNDIKTNVKNFNDFVAVKKNFYTVEVITEDVWGGGTGNKAADNLRKWLTDNYKQKLIKYVLLIGDPMPEGTQINNVTPGTLPMKTTKPKLNTGYDSDWCPTDFYFAELSGNWDINNNGVFAEYADFKTGGVDAFAELCVGRLFVYDKQYDTLAAILQKTITYINETDIAWRKNILMPAVAYAMMSAPCYDIMEVIKKEACDKVGWKYYRMYEQDFGCKPEKVGVSYDAVRQTLTNTPFGMCTWATHGQADCAINVLWNFDAAKLPNTHPAIVFEGSCLNSKVEEKKNLGYTLLKHGGISVLGGTRVTWYHTNQSEYAQSKIPSDQTFVYRVSKSQIYDKKENGIALDEGKAYVEWKQDFMPNLFTYVVYGDPSLSVYGNPPSGIFDNNTQKGPEIRPEISYRHNAVAFQFNDHAFGAGAITMDIITLKGACIYKTKQNFSSPATTILWNYKDRYNRPVPNGMYIARLQYSGGNNERRSFNIKVFVPYRSN